MASWLTELRTAFRSLMRSPGYAAVSILVLGSGIGVSVAVLAIARQALLAPLPYERPDRLMVLFEANESGGRRLASRPTAEDWGRQSRVFEGLAYVTGTQLLLREPSGPELIVTAVPSADFFEVVRARSEIGRTITRDDDARAERVVVLSSALWRRRYAGRSDIVGRRIPLGDGDATVIGVMPPGFRFPEWAEAWMPESTAPASIRQMLRQRANHADSRIVARLADGVSADQARSEMDVIAARLADAYPDDSREWTRVSIMSLADYSLAFTTGSQGQSLAPRIGLFLAAALLLLGLGSANVATLGLVRGMARARELAVRSALGAGRGRIARQLMAESLVLAIAGGALGAALGYGIVSSTRRWDPELFPRLAEVRFDPVFVAIAVVLSLVVAVASGLVPAIRGTPRSLTTLLGGSRGEVGGGRVTGRIQAALIVGQVAVATMLLVGAGLLVKSLERVIATPVGFDANRLARITVSPGSRYDSPDRLVTLYRSSMDAVRRVPGVEDVAFVNHLPLSGGAMPTRVLIEGRDPPPNQPDQANFRTVSPNYFSTVGIPILRGRPFGEADLAGPNGGVVVNQALADLYWPGEDPLGKRVTIFKSARWLPDFGEPMPSRVIGVVGNVRHFGPETDPPGEVYLPYTWNPWQFGGLVIRATVPPETIREPVKRALLAVDPDLPVESAALGQGFRTFDDQLAGLRGPRRLLTLGLAALAGSALGITMLGLYAILAYAVDRRRSELGIRSALGASRGQVVQLVLRDGLKLTGLGLAIGLLGALFPSRLLETLVFGISTRDLLVFSAVPLVLLAVAGVAIALPAIRAAKVDPLEAMRF